MTEDAKKAVVTIASIADDVSSGAYCERMRIGDVQCRAAWLGLMDFILNAIRNNKVRHATDAGALVAHACRSFAPSEAAYPAPGPPEAPVRRLPQPSRGTKLHAAAAIA